MLDVPAPTEPVPPKPPPSRAAGLLLLSRMALTLLAGTAVGRAGSAGTNGPTLPSGPTYLKDVLPILMGECSECHSDQSGFLHNWLNYQTAYAHRWEIKRRIWDSWDGSYFKQPMPVPNSPEFLVMTEPERRLIKEWVEHGAPLGTRPVSGPMRSRGERLEAGRQLFGTICAACHQPTGLGIPGRFPALAGSDFLNADKHRAIQVVVNGLQGEVVVNGQRFNSSMPQFPLADSEIASVLTFVYSAFGNTGKDVTPEEVGAVRAEKPAPGVAGHTPGPRPPEEKSPYE